MELEMQARTYRLGSSEMVHTPGVIAWAKNAYAFEKDRNQLRKIVSETWGVPDEVAHRLLSGETNYTIDGNTVVFSDTIESAC